MRYLYKTKICQSLTFLRTAGEGDELIGNNGHRRNTELFKIALVNYQP